MQGARGVAFTRKDFYGMWDYFPGTVTEPRSGGDRGDARGPTGWTLTAVSVAETAERQVRARQSDR